MTTGSFLTGFLGPASEPVPPSPYHVSTGGVVSRKYGPEPPSVNLADPEVQRFIDWLTKHGKASWAAVKVVDEPTIPGAEGKPPIITYLVVARPGFPAGTFTHGGYHSFTSSEKWVRVHAVNQALERPRDDGRERCVVIQLDRALTHPNNTMDELEFLLPDFGDTRVIEEPWVPYVKPAPPPPLEPVYSGSAVLWPIGGDDPNAYACHQSFPDWNAGVEYTGDARGLFRLVVRWKNNVQRARWWVKV